MRLLFITRKYPPMVGGMENMCFALSKEFPKHADMTLIAWGKSQKYLPYFLSLALIRALFLVPIKRIDHIHLGDGLLAPLGLFLKILFRIKTTVSVHGLDITYKLPMYQFIVPKSVAHLDKVICNSNATMQECIKRGIPAEKCIVIPCGVYPEDFQVQASLEDLENIIGKSLEDKKVIITVGRLVERKGVYWFIENVFKKLDENTLYLVIGDGPEKERIKDLIDRLGLNERILLLGKVSSHDLKVIYNTADLFVMPNIPVPGDMEGFGIVAIEASSTGLVVVASGIEGISDAIFDGKTGYLIHSGNSSHWVEHINIHLSDSNRFGIRNYTEENYAWEKISLKYLACFKK